MINKQTKQYNLMPISETVMPIESGYIKHTPLTNVINICLKLQNISFKICT